MIANCGTRAAATALISCGMLAHPLAGQFLETRASAPVSAVEPGSIALGDFNRDGKEDIAVAVGLGVSVLLGNGDGTFKPGVFYPIGQDQAIYSVVTADFRGNGILDLAATTLNDGVNVLLGNGDGTFGPPTSYPTVATPFYIAGRRLHK